MFKSTPKNDYTYRHMVRVEKELGIIFSKFNLPDKENQELYY